MWFVWLMLNTLLAVIMVYVLRLIFAKLNALGHVETILSRHSPKVAALLPLLRNVNQFRHFQQRAASRWEEKPEFKQLTYSVNYIVGQITDKTSEMTPKVTRKTVRAFAFLSGSGIIAQIPLNPVPQGMNAKMNEVLNYSGFLKHFTIRLATVLAHELATDPNSHEITNILRTCREELHKLPSFRKLNWLALDTKHANEALHQLKDLDAIQEWLLDTESTKIFVGKRQAG